MIKPTSAIVKKIKPMHKKKKRASPDSSADVKNSHGESMSIKEYALEQTLEATNRSLSLYRERIEGFINTNDTLQEQCVRQEHDALQVIAALQTDVEQRESDKRDRDVQVSNVHDTSILEREAMKVAYERKLADINAILSEKEAAFNVMQDEFSVIKDFRKKRHELFKDLEAYKEEINDTEHRHREIVVRMERKFFEDKIRLQKDANRKISELATKAHKEAVANLKETTKDVYRENIRVSEALAYHVDEVKSLKKNYERLSDSNRILLEEKELHDVIIREKILQHKQQSQEIQQLHIKIESMEHSLTHVVREFEHERELIGTEANRQMQEIRASTIKLSTNLTKKCAEMKHIKRLAQHILDQRTSVEKFFMDALEEVREAGARERQELCKREMDEYNRRIKSAIIGHAAAEFPIIRSFRKPGSDARIDDIINSPALPSIFNDTTIGDSECITPIKQPAASAVKALDISELNWIDKERVLRLLFSKMNGISLSPDDNPVSDNADCAQSLHNAKDQDPNVMIAAGEYDHRNKTDPWHQIQKDTAIRVGMSLSSVLTA